MPKPAIHFFTEGINYDLKKKTIIRSWINDAISNEGFILEELNFILCSDSYLLGINQQFLNHDTYTDVITFDNAERLKTINGDIFISIQRIQENAVNFKQPVFYELCRVMVHGTLHLMGYKDKTKATKLEMTKREDYYLALL